MASAGVPDIHTDGPASYEIKVRGALDQTWCDLMDRMTLTVVYVDSQPVTVISVVVRNQAALAGLLDTLFSLNATVLSVEALRAE